ncbi:MAG: hypothetical protein ABEJ66_03710, partial [Candidatus Nanohaloarchaea archaeon]
DTTITVVENRSLSIDGIHTNTGDKALINGDYYSTKAPLPSLAAIPSYLAVDAIFGGGMQVDYYLESFRRTYNPKMAWGRFAATVTVSSVAGAATAALIFLMSMELGLRRKKSIILALVTGMGTLVFPYSTTFHGTMLGGFLLISSVYISLKENFQPTTRRGTLISILVGLGVSASYPVAVPGGALLTVLAAERYRGGEKPVKEDGRFYMALGTGLVAGLLPLLLFHTFTTGNPLLPPKIYDTQPEGVDKLPLGDGGSLKDVFLRFTLDPSAEKIVRMLFGPMNGLFLYSPVLIFGLIGMKRLYSENKPLFWTAAAGFSVSVLALSIIQYWLMRAFYGPRYLLPASLLLIAGLTVELRESGRLESYTIYLLSIFSTLVMLGSTQPWMGHKWKEAVRIAHESGSRLVIENRLFHYMASMPEKGLRSPILSFLTGASPDFH